MKFRDKLTKIKQECSDKRLSDSEEREVLWNAISEEERARPLNAGKSAPFFVLRDIKGGVFDSADALANGPAVITFYRGLWCPYCQSDLSSFEKLLDKIRSLGAVVAGVGHELPADRGRSGLNPEHVNFPILDDLMGDVAVGFGIRWPSEDMNHIRACLGLTYRFFGKASRGSFPCKLDSSWIGMEQLPSQKLRTTTINGRNLTRSAGSRTINTRGGLIWVQWRLRRTSASAFRQCKSDRLLSAQSGPKCCARGVFATYVAWCLMARQWLARCRISWP